RQPEFGYRIIMARDNPMTGRGMPELTMTAPVGVRFGDPRPPLSIEIIAYDQTAGVFNYYTMPQSKVVHGSRPIHDHVGDDAQWELHGSSMDLAMKGAATDGESRFCANCHPGGGLQMKELDSPWIHWNQVATTLNVQGVLDQISSQTMQEPI